MHGHDDRTRAAIAAGIPAHIVAGTPPPYSQEPDEETLAKRQGDGRTTIAAPYAFDWQGETYIVSLRTAPDGYLTGADRAAAETLVAIYIGTAGTALGAEAAANQLFSLLARVARAADPSRFVDAPWPSWLDIPDAVTGGLINDFFFCFRTKASASSSSASITATLAVLNVMFAARTGSGTASPASAPASETANTSTEPGPSSM